MNFKDDLQSALGFSSSDRSIILILEKPGHYEQRASKCATTSRCASFNEKTRDRQGGRARRQAAVAPVVVHFSLFRTALS
jgi:hypothetical protein